MDIYFHIDYGLVANPLSSNFATELGLAQTVMLLVDFIMSSRPCLHTTSCGSIPIWSCFSGGLKIVISILDGISMSFSKLFRLNFSDIILIFGNCLLKKYDFIAKIREASLIKSLGKVC